MNILITGTRGLASALKDAYIDQSVTSISKSNGFNINNVDQWGYKFLESDMVINCAYDGIGQQKVLEYFFEHWQADHTKTIVTIGSKIISQPRIELEQDHLYWPYRVNKQTLQCMHNAMSSTAKCNLKIINPGSFDSDMVAAHNVPKLSLVHLASKIKMLIEDPTIRRVDLWL